MLLQDFRKLLERAGQCSPPRAGYNNYGSGRERGPDRRSPLTNNVSLHGDPSRARNSTSKAVPRPGVGADAARAAARHRGCRGCRGPNVRLLSRGGKGALLRRATGSPVVVLCAAPRPAQFLPSRTGRVRAGRVRAQIQRPRSSADRRSIPGLWHVEAPYGSERTICNRRAPGRLAAI